MTLLSWLLEKEQTSQFMAPLKGASPRAKAMGGSVCLPQKQPAVNDKAGLTC